jgi:DNA topoisomerase-1
MTDHSVPDLRYVSYTDPGISRVRRGTGFEYRDPSGLPIRSPDILLRIRKLAIPPAWSDVWICTAANGHLQAVGRDARGRRQYRYHPLWRAHRDAAKFSELLALARALPALRKRVREHLARPGLPREKILAAVVQLLERTLIRIGNAEYAHENNSFGLTTLEDSHAQVDGSAIRFEFRGKSGKLHVVDVSDVRLARIVQRCEDLPGQQLFQYVDPRGQRRDVGSDDVNTYLRAHAQRGLTAKDFRTWAATVSALTMLRKAGRPATRTQAWHTVASCVRTVAGALGNTPAICRKSYIHPGVIDSYTSGELEALCRGRVVKLGLTADERVAVRFLENVAARLARDS